MILATTKVKDLDLFLEVYGTAGADKRGSHGSKGSTVYRDPIEEDRVWAVFDWDEAGWTAFATDPETPGIMQEAGHLRPAVAGTVPRDLLGIGVYRRDRFMVKRSRCGPGSTGLRTILAGVSRSSA